MHKSCIGLASKCGTSRTLSQRFSSTCSLDNSSVNTGISTTTPPAFAGSMMMLAQQSSPTFRGNNCNGSNPDYINTRMEDHSWWVKLYFSKPKVLKCTRLQSNTNLTMIVFDFQVCWCHGKRGCQSQTCRLSRPYFSGSMSSSGDHFVHCYKQVMFPAPSLALSLLGLLLLIWLHKQFFDPSWCVKLVMYM